MYTIAKTVEEIVAKSPFLSEALSEGIANCSAVARKIMPAVEAKVLENVSEASIIMALRRLPQTSKHPEVGTKYLPHIREITVKSNLTEFVFAQSASLFQSHHELLTKLKDVDDVFLNASHGMHESIIVINDKYSSIVRDSFSDEKEVKVYENLSALVLRLPTESALAVGVYYPFLKALAWEGISFVEIVSANTECILLFEDEDINKSFSIIKSLVA